MDKDKKFVYIKFMKYMVLLLFITHQLIAAEDKLKFSANILAASSKTDELTNYKFLHSIFIMYSKKQDDSNYDCYLTDKTTNNACEENGENSSMYSDAISFDLFKASTENRGSKLNCNVERLENNRFKLTANKKLKTLELNYVFTFDSSSNVKDFEGQFISHEGDITINLIPIPSNGTKDKYLPITKIPTNCKNIAFDNSFKGKD